MNSFPSDHSDYEFFDTNAIDFMNILMEGLKIDEAIETTILRPLQLESLLRELETQKQNPLFKMAKKSHF